MSDQYQNDECLEMLDALDPVGKEAHIEYLLGKYRKDFADAEAEMEKQFSLEF